MTIEELAKASGLEPHEYDTAIPQDWWDRAHAVTGDNPRDYNIVWCYRNSLLGFPMALDPEAAYFLAWALQVRPA